MRGGEGSGDLLLLSAEAAGHPAKCRRGDAVCTHNSPPESQFTPFTRGAVPARS